MQTDHAEVDPNPEDRSTSEPSKHEHPGNGNPLRILVVDDGAETPAVLRHLADGVEDGSCVVECVVTVADGFGALIGDGPDVCIIAHHIGARTGFDLLARINAEGLHVPIIFVVGSGDHGTGAAAVAAGATSYIVEDDLSPLMLDHYIHHAIDRQSTLFRLSEAGIAVDGGAPTRTQILSHISGRLSGPASTILQTARTSMDSQLPPDIVKSLATIEDEAARLLTLTNDLVDLSMLESGHLQIDATPFDLRDLVSSVVRIVGPSAAEHGIEIAGSVADEIPTSVIGDPSRLRLVLVRFLDNVTAQANGDRIDLEAAVHGWGPDIITVGFSVSVGAEAPPSNDPSGAPRERDRHSPGSAADPLNIPVALEIVSRMGGKVSVTSNDNCVTGIQFTVRFTIPDDAQGRPLLRGRSPIDTPVLIIADAVERRRELMGILGEAKLPYLVASSADEWVESGRNTDEGAAAPAIAVIESATDSFDACDRFLELTQASIPVIVITASGQRGDAARCHERGIRGYLSRPMTPGDLADSIRASMALIESGDDRTLVTRHWLREGRRSLNILVVDDSSTSRFLLTRMLDHRGHSTKTASDGEEAIAAVQENQFDVVLMDILMPGMDGFEATRLIRSMNDGAANHPLIIGVSAFVDESYRERGHAAGMDDFLSKPLRPDDLLAVVEQQPASDRT